MALKLEKKKNLIKVQVSIYRIPQPQKPPYALIGAVDIGWVKGERIRIVGRGKRIAVGIKSDILIKRVIGSGNNKWVSSVGCPVQQIFNPCIEFKVVKAFVGKLYVLDTPGRGILLPGI